MPTGGAKGHSIALFYLSTFLYWTSMYVYMPILAVHAENLGATIGLIGTIVGAYGFSQLAFRIPLGVWSDRIGMRKPFILAGLVAASVGALGLGLATDPHWLVLWRGVSGVGAAAWVAFTVLFSSYFPPEKASRAMSQVVFIAGLGQMMGSFSGGLIAQQWGWEAPFYVGAVLGVLGAVASLGLQEMPVAARREMSARDLFRIGTAPLLVAVSMVAMLSSWTQWVTVYGFTPVYAARLGASRADLGALTTLMQVGYTASTLVCAYFAGRVGMKATLIAGIAIQGLGAVMVPFLDNLFLVGVSQVMGGIGRGMPYPLLMGLSIRAVPPADRATAMGVFQGVYALGMFAGPSTTGLLGDSFGLSSVFFFCGAVTVVAIAVVLGRIPAK